MVAWRRVLLRTPNSLLLTSGAAMTDAYSTRFIAAGAQTPSPPPIYCYFYYNQKQNQRTNERMVISNETLFNYIFQLKKNKKEGRRIRTLQRYYQIHRTTTEYCNKKRKKKKSVSCLLGKKRGRSSSNANEL